VTSATSVECRRATTMASAMRSAATAATAAVAGPRECRGRDCEGCDARCEEEPAHEMSPFER
jgi:hypothetical protein